MQSAYRCIVSCSVTRVCTTAYSAGATRWWACMTQWCCSSSWGLLPLITFFLPPLHALLKFVNTHTECIQMDLTFPTRSLPTSCRLHVNSQDDLRIVNVNNLEKRCALFHFTFLRKQSLHERTGSKVSSPITILCVDHHTAYVHKRTGTSSQSHDHTPPHALIKGLEHSLCCHSKTASPSKGIVEAEVEGIRQSSRIETRRSEL